MRKIIAIIVLAVFVLGTITGLVLNRTSNESKVVYVKGDGIYLRSVKAEDTPSLIAEGTGFAEPILSRDGKQVAYRNEDRLVLQQVRSKDSIMVTDNPRSYCFDSNNKLVVSDKEGAVYRINRKGKKQPVSGDAVYQDFLVSPEGTLYAHAYEKIQRGNQTVLRPLGIVREEKGGFVMVLEGRKQNPSERDLGFAPRLAAFSPKGDVAYIYHCPQSVALASDGVPIGEFNLSQGIYTPPMDGSQVFLPQRGQLTPMAMSGELACVLGFGRNMNKQKQVGVFRPSDGSFRPISDEGMVGMMPSVSESGERVLFVSAPEEVDLEAWMNEPKPILEVQLESGERQTISKESTTYLSPFYVEDDRAVVGLRLEQGGGFSVVRIENGAETVLDDNIRYDVGSAQHGQVSVSQFFSCN